MNKKTYKHYSKEELEHIMNTTGALPVTSDLSDSDDDEQEDVVEFEVLYDSDCDQDYGRYW